MTRLATESVPVARNALTVASEVGVLHTAIVPRPGLELARLTPRNPN